MQIAFVHFCNLFMAQFCLDAESTLVLSLLINLSGKQTHVCTYLVLNPGVVSHLLFSIKSGCRITFII